MGSKQYKWCQEQLDEFVLALKGAADKQFAGREEGMFVDGQQAKKKENDTSNENPDSFSPDLVSTVEPQKKNKKTL